jgi:hypothetical protein
MFLEPHFFKNIECLTPENSTIARLAKERCSPDTFTGSININK